MIIRTKPKPSDYEKRRGLVQVAGSAKELAKVAKTFRHLSKPELRDSYVTNRRIRIKERMIVCTPWDAVFSTAFGSNNCPELTELKSSCCLGRLLVTTFEDVVCGECFCVTNLPTTFSTVDFYTATEAGLTSEEFPLFLEEIIGRHEDPLLVIIVAQEAMEEWRRIREVSLRILDRPKLTPLRHGLRLFIR